MFPAPEVTRAEGKKNMKYFTVKYALKSIKNRIYSLTVRAIDEEDARRIAYAKIDNSLYEIV